jgi:chitinase
LFLAIKLFQQQKKEFSVIAYYSGNATEIDNYDVSKLTHIIYSFTHLKGNQLAIDNADNEQTIKHLVSLKKANPKLKVILSLGGWGGCETCSHVFSTLKGREEFAASVKELLTRYNADGIDLDWEYPAIEGFPDHQYIDEDRANFTALIAELRNVLGKKYEISFAAGGFEEYIRKSVEWDKVAPLVDKINLMSYDLTNGYSTVTGHHTPLYSSAKQKESADRAIRMLDSLGVPRNKIIIGAAFYARTWEKVDSIDNGFYRQGKFKDFVNYKSFDTYFAPDNGYVEFWDSITQAPYRYSNKLKIFATYDNEKSIALKTQYAKKEKLGGVMFWELTCDKPKNGLLDVIYKNNRN